MLIDKYIKEFKNIRPNRSGGNTSPHKVCMLFAVMDLIEEGRLGLNAIYYNDELKRRFTWHFERLKGVNDQNNSANPFYYLRSSSFWHHEIRLGMELEYQSITTPSDRKLLETVSYAYFDDELFLLLKDTSNLTALRVALSENLDSKEEGFRRWALAIGKSEKTVSNYVGALKNTISTWLLDAKLIDANLFFITDYFELVRLIEKSKQVREFVEYNKRGNGIYLAALQLYRAYLDELTDATVQHDIVIIEQDESLEITQKAMLVQARRGQGKFRERLIQQWHSCAVTGYGNIAMLLASHIKPWAQSDNAERLDPYNGLLLVPNLDKAFDLNYVTFSERGKIMISEMLGDYEALGINTKMIVPLHERHQDYMAYHREVFLQKM
jgi:predicted restriction endonuclease